MNKTDLKAAGEKLDAMQAELGNLVQAADERLGSAGERWLDSDKGQAFTIMAEAMQAAQEALEAAQGAIDEYLDEA